MKTATLKRSTILQTNTGRAFSYDMAAGDTVYVVMDNGRLAYVKVSANSSQTYPILSSLLSY